MLKMYKQEDYERWFLVINKFLVNNCALSQSDLLLTLHISKQKDTNGKNDIQELRPSFTLLKDVISHFQVQMLHNFQE